MSTRQTKRATARRNSPATPSKGRSPSDAAVLSGEQSPAAVAERIDLVRRALNMTQVDFASGIGLGKSAYGNWMAGKIPNIRTALLLCDAYDLTLDWIYRGDPSNLRYNLAEAIQALRKVREAPRE